MYSFCCLTRFPLRKNQGVNQSVALYRHSLGWPLRVQYQNAWLVHVSVNVNVAHSHQSTWICWQTKEWKSTMTIKTNNDHFGRYIDCQASNKCSVGVIHVQFRFHCCIYSFQPKRPTLQDGGCTSLTKYYHNSNLLTSLANINWVYSSILSRLISERLHSFYNRENSLSYKAQLCWGLFTGSHSMIW